MEALRIIIEEHQNLWRVSATLESLANEIAEGRPVDTGFFGALFDYLDQFVDGSHHGKEDAYLFPAVRQRSPESAAMLDRLEADHRHGTHAVAALRQKMDLAGQDADGRTAFVTGLRDYAQLVKEHIRIEEKEIMPLARASLTEQDWTNINAAFSNNADPLFGGEAKAEFRQLFHRLVNLAPESVGLGAHAAGNLPSGNAKPTGELLLSATGMESCYGRIKALKGLTVEVHQGELVALVGANGAGKTTFMRTLSGVQPMSAGKIVFAGEDISRLRADLRVRRGICQSPEGRQVFGPLSIEDNLRLGAFTQPKENLQEDMEKVYAMFPILKEKRNLPAGTLSGGQQQMLAIGRALMGRPKLLLLDEPSMGLAPLLVEEVFNVIKSLKSNGMTILLVEQNAAAALAIADRGYVLETGAVTLSGPGPELLANDEVRQAYLGM